MTYETNKNIIMAVMALILLILLLTVIGVAIEKEQCLTYYSKFWPEYSFWEGCKIQVYGQDMYIKPSVAQRNN